MVNVMVDGHEMEFWVIFCDFLEFILQIREHALVEDLATVFGRDDEVVHAVVDRVRLFSYFHA